MGKNKKKGAGPKTNVFKVAGAKSLKKTKAKAVNLGLKNIKGKVQEIDKQFVELSKTRQQTKEKSAAVPPQKKIEKKKVSKEDVSKTVEKIVKMDL